MNAVEQTIANHKVVSEQEWIAARKALLAKEKAFTHERDRLGAQRAGKRS